jgi:murein L,D-transpeptidase YcbB/YkuD
LIDVKAARLQAREGSHGPLMRARVFLFLAWLLLIPLQPHAPAAAAPAPAANDAGLILETLRHAEDQGFRAGEFGQDAGAAAIAYARAQHGGRLSAGAFPEEWAIRPAPYDAQADFAAALAQHGLAGWLTGLPPPDVRYARLVEAYGRYRRIAAQGGWPALGAGPALKLGATGERVEALRRRLAVEDPAVAPAAAGYDAALAEAVSRAQARYGLSPDGVAGAATVQALDVPVEQRLRQIQANLERWRWMPRAGPSLRVELNIAAATLELYDVDKPALAMRAIVGQPSKRTPMFTDSIRAIVLNPPWNVPPSIAAKEIWPKIRRDPGYMAREGFVVTPGGGLQQRPGPRCALGTIKFDLSNSFGVYLHDTPSHSLFARDARALSHGCMRLEQPGALAKRLLRGDPDWPEDKVDIAILAGATRRIALARPVPVVVAYWTAFVDDQGRLNLRSDVYGWDQQLLAML